MKRKAFTAKGAAAVGPYSQAVEMEGLVYLSGQTPMDSTTGTLAAGGIKEQTAQCFKNLIAVLESCGLSTDDVIKTTVFLTDMSFFKEMNEIYKQQFSEPYPARSTIGVKELPLNALIEIEMIAKR